METNITLKKLKNNIKRLLKLVRREQDVTFAFTPSAVVLETHSSIN